MNGEEDINANEEKELVRELDECAFLYGEEFTKLAEQTRTIAAAKYSAENAKQAPAPSERKRVHIDLGETKSGKLTPAPDTPDKTLTADKKKKK